MTENSTGPADTRTAHHHAGRRVFKNTSARVTAEVIGKLATFALFAVLARSVSQSSVGNYVFAFAFLQVVMIPIGIGTDPMFLRKVAKDPVEADRLFFNLLGLKLVMAGPVIVISFVAVFALGYGPEARDTVIVLSLGVMFDVLSRTVHSLFNALEKGGLLATSLVVQRVITAVAGILVLLAGYSVVAVAAIYSVGSAIGFAVAIALLARDVGLPRRTFAPRRLREIVPEGLPFAVQDIFTVLLFKVDAILLSLLSTQAAVGRYGAAYRILESTLFITWALNGAFAAMYAYLGPDTVPTIQSVFQRSIKLALVLLIPCSMILGVFAAPIAELAFGATLADSSESLQLLAPIVVMLCLVALSTSLIISRRSPLIMAPVTVAMVAFNIALNVVLIPHFADRGAALAMLITEAVLALIALVLATRTIGGLQWVRSTASPLLAGIAMLASMLLLSAEPIVGIIAGTLTYAVLLLLLEQRLNPADLRFILDIIRKRRLSL